jgi:UDP-glucose 4-epimerase
MRKVVVTGAAGFIGSHLTDALLDAEYEVLGLDNLSTGKMENLGKASRNHRFRFARIDLRRPMPRSLAGPIETIYHFAADPEVRTGLDDPSSQFENNILATYNVLEFARQNAIENLFFASSSTVYGEPLEIPTPEDYSPLAPISVYGAAKLACEDMIRGYSSAFGIKSFVLRPANVVGPRATHGVVLDFIIKLRKDKSVLEILGDGKQSKSYVGPDDVVRAILMIQNARGRLGTFEVFNIGNGDRTSVLRIAELVSESMNARPRFLLSGGIEGGRAWKGDVKIVLLTTDKLRRLGWEPAKSSDDTVRRAAESLVADLIC